ncbi:MAG: serine/threonine protein kinase, partial [Calditrichaeota bacterium]|nr:serine/threonine protein kinase [Calditrichota bacterium]
MAGVGQTFAQYRIERELHRGPSAVSYVAVDTVLERRVLLKVLEPEGHSTEQLKQFRVEALAYARLQHPNIVTLYQFDTWQGHTFLVLEFVDGRSLAELIRDFGPLPLDVALTISRDLFRGLAYAHERGVLHRDLKPSNVLVANDGWTKVADFGLAALGERGDAPKPGVTGTLAYMAPEVLRGEGATERSDLYSAGATLYEMLAGRRLFQSEEVTSCAEAVLNGHWQPLKALRSDIPESMAELVHGLLALSPGDRPTSAAAVVERLNQIAAEESVTLRAEVVRRFLAEPPPARAKPKTGQTLRRATKLSSAVLGALLVLVVLA